MRPSTRGGNRGELPKGICQAVVARSREYSCVNSSKKEYFFRVEEVTAGNMANAVHQKGGTRERHAPVKAQRKTEISSGHGNREVGSNDGWRIISSHGGESRNAQTKTHPYS